jgi:hypothetical protein
VAKALRDDNTVREVNKIESSDDDDYMGELDDELFYFQSDNEFLRKKKKGWRGLIIQHSGLQDNCTG